MIKVLSIIISSTYIIISIIDLFTHIKNAYTNSLE